MAKLSEKTLAKDRIGNLVHKSTLKKILKDKGYRITAEALNNLQKEIIRRANVHQKNSHEIRNSLDKLRFLTEHANRKTINQKDIKLMQNLWI